MYCHRESSTLRSWKIMEESSFCFVDCMQIRSLPIDSCCSVSSLSLHELKHRSLSVMERFRHIQFQFPFWLHWLQFISIPILSQALPWHGSTLRSSQLTSTPERLLYKDCAFISDCPCPHSTDSSIFPPPPQKKKKRYIGFSDIGFPICHP